MWSIFMFNPYLSCTLYKYIYFFYFSNVKEKGGGVYVLVYNSWKQLQPWPFNHFTSFQNCFQSQQKIVSNVLLTFQPVDVSSFFILSMFQNLCWHMKKWHHHPTQSGIFYYFFKRYFPKTQKSFFFLSIAKQILCIELVNIQKFYFLFPLEELHFV